MPPITPPADARAGPPRRAVPVGPCRSGRAVPCRAMPPG